MGARQSVAQPPHLRTMPSNPTASTSGNVSTDAHNNNNHPHNHHRSLHGHELGPTTSSTADVNHIARFLSMPAGSRYRSRSVGNIIRNGAAGPSHETDSDSSSEDHTGVLALNRLLRLPSGNTAILPSPAFRYFDFKCPICNKTVPSDDIECHLVMCLTRPRIGYNEDILTEDRGECPICFDDMNQGDTIARLPCLCVYHKRCIDSWFTVKNTCPSHPGDD